MANLALCSDLVILEISQKEKLRRAAARVNGMTPSYQNLCDLARRDNIIMQPVELQDKQVAGMAEGEKYIQGDATMV